MLDSGTRIVQAGDKASVTKVDGADLAQFDSP